MVGSRSTSTSSCLRSPCAPRRRRAGASHARDDAQAIQADHVRAARAKGSPNQRSCAGTSSCCAIIPVKAYLGVVLGTLLGGAVIVENLFNWDGVGRALMNAVYDEDNPVVVGIVTYGVVVFVASAWSSTCSTLVGPEDSPRVTAASKPRSRATASGTMSGSGSLGTGSPSSDSR